MMIEDKLKKNEWTVSDINQSDASKLVRDFHYSKGGSITSVYRHGLFRIGDPSPKGVAVWLPPTRVCAESVNKDGWKMVLSLTRLVCHPDCPKNAASFLLSNSIKKIKKDGRFLSLVTFADERMGHTGAIYKATNWQYLGLTKPTPCWIDPSSGRQVAIKSTKHRTVSEMRSLGYEKIGSFRKHKFVIHF